MEKIAKKILKEISEKVSLLTDQRISRIAHAPNYREWRAYICQNAPFWEDITWRVKEPNSTGESEIHIGFYSTLHSEELTHAITLVEELATGHNTGIKKNQNGIRLIWTVQLENDTSIDNALTSLNSLLPSFFNLATNAVCKNAISSSSLSPDIEYLEKQEQDSQDSLNNDPYLNFLQTNSDFVIDEKHKLFISGEFFNDLLTRNIRYLYFSFSNGNDSIENNNGSDYFELIYDISMKCALPVSSNYFAEDYFNDPDYKFKIYTNSWHAGLDEIHYRYMNYNSEFDFSALGFEWTVAIDEENYNFKGNLEDSLQEQIKQSVTSKVIFNFLSEILKALEVK